MGAERIGAPMPEESLVVRLRALEAILSRAADLRVHVENDPLWLVEYGHVEDAVGEAADALERAVKDTARLDWLEERVVNVRVPLVYGSHDLFWASPDEYESPSDLREQIDRALSPSTKDETK